MRNHWPARNRADELLGALAFVLLCAGVFALVKQHGQCERANGTLVRGLSWTGFVCVSALPAHAPVDAHALSANPLATGRP